MSASVDWQKMAGVLDSTPQVVAAWVFGSAQNGEIRPGSDLDLGILFTASPSLDDLADLRTRLQQALGVDEIDLLALNQASPIVRFEAISGRSVFCRDVGRRAEFASLTAREYEDEMALAQWALHLQAAP